MKNIIKGIAAVLLVVCMMVPLFVHGSAADEEMYIVTAEQTKMLADADEDAAFICNVYKGTVVTVTETRFGYGYVYRKSVSLGGWIDLNDLKKVSDDYSEDNIVGLEISLPDKLTYIVGEDEFDKTGMSVCVVYDNNDKVEVTDYLLYLPVLDSLGAKTVTVYYKSFSSGKSFMSNFVISVEKVPIRRISVERTPATEIVEGTALSLDGLAVRVQYLDGRTDRIFTWNEIKNNPDFTVTVDGKVPDNTPLSRGEYTVEIAYMYPEHTTSYTVAAVDKRPAQLQVLQNPYNNKFYSDTLNMNMNGLVLTLIYTNGTTETVDGKKCEIIFDPEQAFPGKNNVTVRYRGVETTVEMEMIKPTLIGIEIADPGRTVYMQGALFDGSNTVVNGIYDSGSRVELSNWGIVDFDTQTLGKNTVEIRYDEFSAFYDIYVTVTGYLGGDADLDGSLTAGDARLILRHSVGLEALVGTALFVADRDGNGIIDAGDARSTLRASVALEPVYIVAEE